jgi:hypothetical protein
MSQPELLASHWETHRELKMDPELERVKADQAKYRALAKWHSATKGLMQDELAKVAFDPTLDNVTYCRNCLCPFHGACCGEYLLYMCQACQARPNLRAFCEQTVWCVHVAALTEGRPVAPMDTIASLVCVRLDCPMLRERPERIVAWRQVRVWWDKVDWVKWVG